MWLKERRGCAASAHGWRATDGCWEPPRPSARLQGNGFELRGLSVNGCFSFSGDWPVPFFSIFLGGMTPSLAQLTEATGSLVLAIVQNNLKV